jgi:hypothetical protein
MPLLEINQICYISAVVRLAETTAEQVDQYATFANASPDDFQEFLKTPQATQVNSTLRIRRGPRRDRKDGAEQSAKKLSAGVGSTTSVRVVKA